jgi:phage-related protein (TIGR01555 family)
MTEPFTLKINPDIINGFAYKRTRNITPENAWQLYAPPATLGMLEDEKLAMDNHLQACGYHSLIAHAIGLGMGMEEIAPQFLGYAYLAGLSQNGLIRAGVTTVAEEMTKKWIEIKRGGESPENDETVKALTAAMTDFNIQALFNEAAQKCDFDGGCLIYIDTGEEGQALEEPLILDPAVFAGRKVRRFTLVEAINLYPGLYNATDPLNPDYFTPTHWLVLGKRIHKSRFLYFAPNKMPLLLRPAYNFFGLPAAQLCLDYVAHFTKTREAAQRLLTKFSLTVFKSDMSAILTNGMDDNFDRRMQYLAQWRDNDMILAVDKEKEDVVKLETPLSGVVDIVRQSLEFVAAIFRIPFVKFLGISPGGLNATGESDLRNFYDHVGSKQQKILKHPLDRVLDVLQLHLFGQIDPEISFDFCPLTDEDDSQREATQKLKADRLVVLSQASIIGEDEARRVLADDPDSGLNFIDPDAAPMAPEDELGMAPEIEAEEAKMAVIE